MSARIVGVVVEATLCVYFGIGLLLGLVAVVVGWRDERRQKSRPPLWDTAATALTGLGVFALLWPGVILTHRREQR